MMINEDSHQAMSSGAAAPDDRGLLRHLIDNGFDGSVEATALVLGRDEAHLSAVLDGDLEADEDLLMKVRGIADERNITI
jgi:hypothetical protein